MASRFKFLSTTVPKNDAAEIVQPKFNKLTLAHTKRMEIEKTTENAEEKFEGKTTTTTTTKTRLTATLTETQKIISTASNLKSNVQKPKILMSESTIKTLEKNEDSDVMTDDDTDSVGSSVDSDFIHRALIESNDESHQQNERHCIDIDSQFQRLSISISAADTKPTISNEFLNMSHQFDQMGIVDGRKSISENCTVLTLSSTDEEPAEQDTNSAHSSSQINDIIVITDSDADDHTTSIQPPLATDEPNVSDIYSNSLKLPSTPLMKKIDHFFDNVPSLDTDTTINTSIISEKMENDNSDQESIYISETSQEDNDHDSIELSKKCEKSLIANVIMESESVIATSIDCQINNRKNVDVNAETNNEIKIDIPVSKSSSDQPRQLVKSQSGIKLTTTRSTPIIESTIRKPQVSAGTNLSATVKNAGSSIKLLTDSNGQVNISAKININIQINQIDDESTSEDSNLANNEKPQNESPAIELNIENIHAKIETPHKESKTDDKQNENDAAEKNIQSESVFKTIVIRQPNENTPQTPADKLSKFQFSAPTSLTKSTTKKQLYKTPKRTPKRTPKQQNTDKENSANNFIVDKNIPVDAKDQKLLHQVYGDAWKTPEVLKCYSAVKGKSQLIEETRLVQSANCANKVTNSRISRGFMCFKRNIAADFDSTRLTDCFDALEVSPVKLLEDKTAAEIASPLIEKKDKSPPTNNIKTSEKEKLNVIEMGNVSHTSDEEENEIIEDDDDEEYVASDDDDIYTSDEDTNGSDSDYEDTPRKAKLKTDTSRQTKPRITRAKTKQKDDLIYLDLSSENVKEARETSNHDVSEENFREITRRFLDEDLEDFDKELTKKPRRRKLFNPHNHQSDNEENVNDKPNESRTKNQSKDKSDDRVQLKLPIPYFKSLTHKLFDAKSFDSPEPKRTPKSKLGTKVDEFKTPNPVKKGKETYTVEEKTSDTSATYSFLKSLDVISSLKLCHPDAIKYRKNFNANRDELTDKLYKMYNEKVFDNKLNITVAWNKKLTCTAGRCLCNKRAATGRTARVELSEKVLTSGDRLRCTLIHELCHAATWLFNGDKGHGTQWKSWASKANYIFPELPKIAVCHEYNIEYKYTYQCDLCHSKSYSHSKSKKTENIRCAYCHGSISIYLNKKQKDGQIVQTPVRKASGFAMFVKEKYKDFKEPGVKHAEVMKKISTAFAALSVVEKKKYS